LATSPACACSQENLQGGGDNSAFTDPDNQVKNFGGRAQARKQLPDDPAVERAAGHGWNDFELFGCG
jgi:hypothetical protein